MQTFHYVVDGEPQSTTFHELTAAQVLTAAGKDPSNHYLVLLEGHEEKSFEGKLDEVIRMHERMKFISISFAPTPVS